MEVGALVICLCALSLDLLDAATAGVDHSPTDIQ